MPKALILANSSTGLYDFRNELLLALMERGYKIVVSLPDDRKAKELADELRRSCTVEELAEETGWGKEKGSRKTGWRVFRLSLCFSSEHRLCRCSEPVCPTGFFFTREPARGHVILYRI